MYYINESVLKLNRIFDQNSREGYLRLDLNENPTGLPIDFIKNVLNDVDQEFISKYPETEEFQKKLADFIKVNPNQICLTNGSAEAIRHIFEVYSRPNGKIVSVAPSYAMYEVYANMYGRKHVGVPYDDDFTISIDKIIEAIPVYDFDKEEIVFDSSTRSVVAKKMYDSFIKTYNIDKNPREKWAFDIALDCSRFGFDFWFWC